MQATSQRVRGQGNQSNCLTLRQWSLLFSIIIFVLTAVTTTCAALAKMHTRDILDLVRMDLDEEQEENEYLFYGTKHHVTPNESKLQLSEQYVYMILWLLYICTWIGCLNLTTVVLLMYGIATKNTLYIIPWILVSGMTYLLFVSAFLGAYLEMVPGIYISFNSLVVSLGFSIVFMVMWYMILFYYVTLTRNTCTARYPTITPTVIKAYGGYMHTINPTLSSSKKDVV